ncbi:MAG: CPBP family intramembrane glutamic endopeptidase [Bacteroidia bacterium]
MTGVKKSAFLKIIEFPLTRILLAIGFFALAGWGIDISLTPLKSSSGNKDAETEVIRHLVIIFYFTLAYIAFVRIIERRPVTELSLHGAGTGLTKGVFISILLVVFVYGILLAGGWLRITGINPPSAMLLPFVASLLAGVTEELVVRGVLYRITEEKLGTVISLIITSAIFGALHLMNKHATLMGAASIALTAGLMLGLAYTYTKQLWMSIGLHAGWNFITGGIFGTSVSGNDKTQSLFNNELNGPELLTGGMFGPEASLQIIFAGLVVSVVLYVKSKKEGKLVFPFWKAGKVNPETPQ